MIRILWALAALTLPLATGAAAQAPSSIAAVEGGRVQGAVQGDVASWKGIPFAAPPTGANRWRAPQPVVAWAGVRDATRYGHDCMQKPFPSDAAPLGTEPAEDCLVANVWRPAAATAGAKLPVLLWIYGGGFVNGGSSPAVYSGEKFARQGVLFVSFNYRLGRFGFFAHPALTAAHEGPLANYGYMDQIAALKWVHANIARFGGDPGNVTVVGESAGGGSALMVLTSPLTRGLFKRVVVMSGGGRGSLLPARRLKEDQPGSPSAETVGMNFASSVGIEGTGPDALARLRALPAEQLTGDLNLATLMGQSAKPTFAGPVEDGTVVVGPPDALLASGAAPAVPVMIGSNTADIGFNTAASKDALFAGFGDKAQAARTAYDPTGAAPLTQVGTALSADRIMTEPARHIAGLISAHGQPAYYYRFGYVAETMKGEWKTGAPHATDIPWAFDTVDAKYGDKLTAHDETVAKTWNTYFANFAKTGDPNGAGAPRWAPYTPAGSAMMFITAHGAAVGEADPWRTRLDLVEAQADAARAGAAAGR